MERVKSICEPAGVVYQVEELQRIAPSPCSPLVQEATRIACEGIGITPYTLASGAGHDGMQLIDLCPIGMIFVRSKDGISHNPAEWSSLEDCADGIGVLYNVLLDTAVQAQ